MKKLALGLGIAVLAVAGPVVAWKYVGDERRAGALGPLEKPIALSWRGTWTRDAEYAVGQVVSYGGSSYVAEAQTAGQVPNAKEGPWALMAAKGLQGAAGTFSGTFTSPNGTYSLTVADSGIALTGGEHEVIRLTGAGIELETGQAFVVSAGGEVQVQSGAGTTLAAQSTVTLDAVASATVKGSILRLNCPSGGRPVARQGDQVQMGPQGSPGQILQGSTTVLTC